MRVRTPLVLLAAVAVAILWGCTGSTATLPDADFFVTQGAPFQTRVGETVGVETPDSIILVSMSDVLDDSRCPVNVACVDAGHATVRLAIQTALAVQDVDIEVPPTGEVQVVVEEVTVTVLGLLPEAQEGVTIGLLEYLVGLRVVQTGEIGDL